ncbi:P-loop-containing nucleoside triphosphate hydrolase [Chloropicon primus]|nr:P-loop-containing nucleoside triphosphate hydrolase [Chloropicon primus]
MSVTEADQLYSVSDVPEEYREVFQGRFQYFNWIQSECFHQLFKTDENMVIGSPTGSGKTVLMELAMTRVLMTQRPGGGPPTNPGCVKIIYLAPTHALVHEKHVDWQQNFGGLGLKAVSLTRAEVLDVGKEIRGADIILTTPEKFDAITRKRKNLLMSFLADIALVLIDEVHILNDERGSTLEAIVSRLKLVSQIPEMMSSNLPISRIRYVAVSATVPNIGDIGRWLQCPPEAVKSYGDEMRPVKLRTTVLGYQPCKNNFMFEKNLNLYVYDVLCRYGRGKSSIVFCASRQDAANCASTIFDKARSHFLLDQSQAETLLHQAELLENAKLKSLVRKGIAFHHAALGMNDKKIVEELFLSRQIIVLCSTSTLAYGVNLPAFLVVLKSTRYWSSKASCYEEYDKSLCLQMAGRAGRPQFETEGQCVIMTERSKVHRYRNIMEGLEEIESNLWPSIREHLNNEVGLLTVRSIEDCEEWLRSTFLGVRIFVKPRYYANQMKLPAMGPGELLREMCKRAIEDLKSLEMVSIDVETGRVEQLEPGRILSHYYLKLDTLKNFQKCKEHLSLEGSLWLIAASSEFNQTIIRRAERRTLNALNTKGGLKYFVPQQGKPAKPLKSLKTPCQKVFLLIQEALSISQANSTLDHGLRCEREEFLRTGPRIAGAAAQYFLHTKQFAATANCLLLSKSLKQRMWPDSDQHCRQMAGVGQVIANRLTKAGLSTLDDLEKATVLSIESAALQKYPFGSKIKSELKKLPPKLHLALQLSGTELQVVLSLAGEEDYKSNTTNQAWILVGCTQSDEIVFSESIKLDETPFPYTTGVSIAKSKEPCSYVAACIASQYFGRDTHKDIQIQPERGSALLKDHYPIRRAPKQASTRPAMADKVKKVASPDNESRKRPPAPTTGVQDWGSKGVAEKKKPKVSAASDLTNDGYLESAPTPIGKSGALSRDRSYYPEIDLSMVQSIFSGGDYVRSDLFGMTRPQSRQGNQNWHTRTVRWGSLKSLSTITKGAAVTICSQQQMPTPWQ